MTFGIRFSSLASVFFRTLSRPAGLTLLSVAVTACDPCTGVSACRTAPRVELTGQVVEYYSARGIPAVQLSMKLADGTTATALTDDEGRFRLSAPSLTAAVGDSATVEVSMSGPAPFADFTASALRVRTVMRTGDAVEVGRWMRNPGRRIVLRLLSRLTGGPLSRVPVTFVRTGGAKLIGDSIRSLTDDGGTVVLNLSGDRIAEVVGLLRVANSQFRRPSELPNLGFGLSLTELAPTINYELSVGPALSYVGEVRDGLTRREIVGASVTFTARSGPSTVPASATTTSGAGGIFTFAVPTTDFGDVLGTLTVLGPGAPASQASVYPNVILAAFDSLNARWMGTWYFGLQAAKVNSVVEIWAFSTMRPTAGIPVLFRRTGGLTIETPTIQLTSGADGRVRISSIVSDTGAVIGDLVLNVGSPDSTRYSGISLRAERDDSLRFYGVLGYGPSLRYLGEVLKLGSAAPLVGASVRFARTSGIRLAQDVVDATTNAVGQWPFGLIPLESGTVFGTLTITPPAPWTGGPIVYSNVPLTTYASPDLRLAGTFRVPVP